MGFWTREIGGKQKEALRAEQGILRTIQAYFERHRLGELLVLKGVITPAQLRQALQIQKQSALPLGQVFLEHAMVSRRQLAGILVRQSVIRTIATLAVGLMTFTGDQASADDVKAPSALSVSYNAMAAYPNLLGSNERQSANLGPFTKWTGMLNRFESQMRSREDEARAWNASFQSFQGLPLKTMASRVNDLMNRKPYIGDKKNWGKSDYWGTPLEFSQRGGDCEDFAIAKYAALRSLGVPEERLRITIVQDTQKNIPHAVLAVYTDEGVYILDQQIKTMNRGSQAGRYRPIFSINSNAWWLHTSRGATQLASR